MPRWVESASKAAVGPELGRSVLPTKFAGNVVARRRFELVTANL